MNAIAGCFLYGILDFGYVRPEAAAATARLIIEGGIDILQIRAKKLSERQVVEIARAVRPITAAAGVPLILNDHAHLADEVGADGVHVGQDDLPVAEVRAASGRPILVGKSTHSLDQAVAAADVDRPDYIGFGPLFATPTKPDYAPVGLENIEAVQAQVGVPVFCIGGIKLENLDLVLDAGAERVVIVSGILLAPDIANYTRAAKAALTNSQ